MSLAELLRGETVSRNVQELQVIVDIILVQASAHEGHAEASQNV